MKKLIMLASVLLAFSFLKGAASAEKAIHLHLPCNSSSECMKMETISGFGDEMSLISSPFLSIGKEDIVNARLSGTPEYFEVVIDLTAPVGENLKRVTAENVGKRVSIVYEGKIWRSPIIKAPLKDNRFMLRMDGGGEVFSRIKKDLGLNKFFARKKAMDKKINQREYFFYMAFMMILIVLLAAYILWPYINRKKESI